MFVILILDVLICFHILVTDDVVADASVVRGEIGSLCDVESCFPTGFTDLYLNKHIGMLRLFTIA